MAEDTWDIWDTPTSPKWSPGVRAAVGWGEEVLGIGTVTGSSLEWGGDIKGGNISDTIQYKY